MVIKIPKTLVYFATLIVLIAASLWLGMRSQQGVLPTSRGSESVREIEVSAKQFEFSPNPIRVKLGETIRLNIKSTDVTHGFSLPAFGINEVIEAGKTVRVEFQATKRGQFPFACSIFCGQGHSQMRGMLIVE